MNNLAECSNYPVRRFSPKSILLLFSYSAAVFISLLCFPAGLPLLVLTWIFVFVFLLRLGNYYWAIVVLSFLTSVVLLKNTGISFGVVIWIAAFLMATCLTILVIRNASKGNSKQNVQLKGIAIAACGFAGCAVFIDWHRTSNPSVRINLDQTLLQRPIACLGDSLTAAGYPDELQKLVKCKVVNFGRDGIASQDALDLLPELLATKPQLVIVEIGGHDFNQGLPRNETLDRMRKLIQSVRDHDADVVLVEVPRGFVTDPYQGIERQLAREFDLLLISDSTIRLFVLLGPIMPPGTWMPES